ncbi:hypothetical protein [Streptomyces sp. NPDC047123]|uniref:hypothetical protein n=1 Tax=Streptomyces sp. NPDC047123 TaxID=3155622 RepID=UPI0034092555
MTEQERRAQEAYVLQLNHIDACPPCQALEDCPEGARVRRALRAARLATRPGAQTGTGSAP